MEKENIVKNKSRAFAIRIVNLYKHLCENKKEFVISKQILRSGTSIGANVAEALCGISKKDFHAKMYVAFKECVESQYWLDILHQTDYLLPGEFQSMNDDCEELRKLLSSITKTTKERMRD